MAAFERDFGFRDGPKYDSRHPLVTELQALAKRPGVVEKFLLSTGHVAEESGTSPELAEMLRVGRLYHSLGLRKALRNIDKEQGHKIGIYVPNVTKEVGGKKLVKIPFGSEKVEGRLVGLIGARRGRDEEVVFDGIAILTDNEPIKKFARLVGVFADTGISFFPTGSTHSSRLRSDIHRAVPRLL